jgi:hypothetical protein
MRFRCSAARLLSAPPRASLRSNSFCQTDKLLETRANVAKMLDRADALAEYTLLAERNALLLPRPNASRYLRCAQGCNRGSVRLCTGFMFVSIGRADRANPVPNLTRSDRTVPFGSSGHRHGPFRFAGARRPAANPTLKPFKDVCTKLAFLTQANSYPNRVSHRATPHLSRLTFTMQARARVFEAGARRCAERQGGCALKRNEAKRRSVMDSTDCRAAWARSGRWRQAVA